MAEMTKNEQIIEEQKKTIKDLQKDCQVAQSELIQEMKNTSDVRDILRKEQAKHIPDHLIGRLEKVIIIQNLKNTTPVKIINELITNHCNCHL